MATVSARYRLRTAIRAHNHLNRARTFTTSSLKLQHQTPLQERPASATDAGHSEIHKHRSPVYRHCFVRDTGPSGNAQEKTQPKKGSRGVKPTKPADVIQKPDFQHPAQVTLNGEAVQTSPIFLRDLCSCDRCVDSSTRQKLFSTTDIPGDIRVESQTQKDNVLEITWTNDIPGYGDGHVTVIPLSVLNRILKTASPFRSFRMSRRTWNDQDYRAQFPNDVEYDAYMSDDKTLTNVLRNLYEWGLIFIKNVPESEASVSKIANRIGPLKTTFYGETWDVRSVPQAKNVAYTSQNLGFHMDLLYMEQPPHIQLLHCIRSSSAGGASLFTDSFKAIIDLAEHDPAAFRGLMRGRVDYHYDHPSHYYHQARTVIETKPVFYKGRPRALYNVLRNGVSESPGKGENQSKRLRLADHIDAVSWSPPFQAPFSKSRQELSRRSQGVNLDKVRILGATTEQWHADACKFDRLIHRPEAIYERMMQPGQCVLFDNRRVLHARRAFEVGDFGKERWLRGAYIDKDPFMSKLRRMLEQGRSLTQSDSEESSDDDSDSSSSSDEDN